MSSDALLCCFKFTDLVSYVTRVVFVGGSRGTFPSLDLTFPPIGLSENLGERKGGGEGKGRVGETTCLTSPTGFCLKYHPVRDGNWKHMFGFEVITEFFQITRFCVITYTHIEWLYLCPFVSVQLFLSWTSRFVSTPRLNVTAELCTNLERSLVELIRRWRGDGGKETKQIGVICLTYGLAVSRRRAATLNGDVSCHWPLLAVAVIVNEPRRETKYNFDIRIFRTRRERRRRKIWADSSSDWLSRSRS